MTRINCVPPEELSRQHLLAEWREMPRVFSLADKAYPQRDKLMAPGRYTLGPGHVKFFYQRLGYCSRRFFQLKAEMLRRGYVPGFDYPPLCEAGTDWFQDWEPDAEALAINRQRILERTKQK